MELIWFFKKKESLLSQIFAIRIVAFLREIIIPVGANKKAAHICMEAVRKWAHFESIRMEQRIGKLQFECTIAFVPLVGNASQVYGEKWHCNGRQWACARYSIWMVATGPAELTMLSFALRVTFTLSQSRRISIANILELDWISPFASMQTVSMCIPLDSQSTNSCERLN